MSNKLFDILKWVAILLLPASATFIKIVFPIWGLPYGEQIADTIIAASAFLGAILGISNIQYNKKVNNNDNADR